VNDGAPRHTCPFCHETSHRPEDVAHRYCPACKVFVDDVALLRRADPGAHAELVAELGAAAAERRRGVLERWRSWSPEW
jgi:hypothetical protein